jgi:hypothetical protein
MDTERAAIPKIQSAKRILSRFIMKLRSPSIPAKRELNPNPPAILIFQTQNVLEFASGQSR